MNGKSGLGEKGGGGGGGRGKWYPSLECVRSTSASSVGGARELIPRVEGDAPQRAASIQRWNTSKYVICVIDVNGTVRIHCNALTLSVTFIEAHVRRTEGSTPRATRRHQARQKEHTGHGANGSGRVMFATF